MVHIAKSSSSIRESLVDGESTVVNNVTQLNEIHLRNAGCFECDAKFSSFC